jgi:hypothetical protein
MSTVRVRVEVLDGDRVRSASAEVDADEWIDFCLGLVAGRPPQEPIARRFVPAIVPEIERAAAPRLAVVMTAVG